MAPTTPIGSRSTVELPTRSSKANSRSSEAKLPVTVTGSPAWIAFAILMGVPTSAATVVAIASPRAASASRRRSSQRARSSTGVAAQARERGGGGAHRAIHVLRVAPGDATDHLLGRGADDV